MMREIDARGMACPLPVIETKKALKDNQTVVTIVDNDIATQNLKKLADQLTLNYEKETLGANHFVVRISSQNQMPPIEKEIESSHLPKLDDNYLVAVDTNIMGRGSDELGSTLMKAFIYSLLEQDELPKTIIFYNSGVKLAVNDSDCLPDLKEMAEKGVEIYSCGACLNFYELTDSLGVGEITNMYRIVELMRSSSRIVKP